MMNSKKMFFVLITCAMAMATACSDQRGDTLLNSDGECSAPCWASIRPGLTTQSEAENVVIHLEDKQEYSFSENDIYVDYEGRHIHIYSNDVTQIVEGIDFDLDHSSLEEMIDKFGEPEYLSLMLDAGGCVFIIYYPDNGVHFMGQCKPDSTESGWVVSPNSKITMTFFTKPGLQIEELLDLFFSETSKEMMDSIILWNGYNTYIDNR